MGFMDEGKRVLVLTIPDREQATLVKEIQDHVEQGSQLITNEWRGFKNMARFGYPDSIQIRVGLGRGLRPSGIGECMWDFWRYMERYMGVHRGVRSGDYIPRLKECELRWNYRGGGPLDLYKEFIRVLTERPLGVRSPSRLNR